jgi:hypothetical protein
MVADFDRAAAREQQQLPWQDLNPSLPQGDDLSPTHHQYGDGLVNRDIAKRLGLAAMEYTHAAEGGTLRVIGETLDEMGADLCESRAYDLPGIRYAVIRICGLLRPILTVGQVVVKLILFVLVLRLSVHRSSIF